MGMNKGYLTAKSTPESDECLTPRYAVEPIVKHLKNNGYRTIWCPFDTEDSQYVRVLEREGFKVIWSHIDEHCGDFFRVIQDEKLLEKVDCIVSNPPFSKKDEILQAVYKTEKPFMLLLPQNSLQSIRRVNYFKNCGLEYLGFDKRICFYTKSRVEMTEENGKRFKTRIQMQDFNYGGFEKGNHFASGYFCNNVLDDKLVFENLDDQQEPYFTEEELNMEYYAKKYKKYLEEGILYGIPKSKIYGEK